MKKVTNITLSRGGMFIDGERIDKRIKRIEYDAQEDNGVIHFDYYAEDEGGNVIINNNEAVLHKISYIWELKP